MWRRSTLTFQSLIARRISIAASIQKLPDSAVKSFSTARHSVDVSGETIRLLIGLRLATDFLYVTNIKGRWVDNIRMDLQEVGCGYVDWPRIGTDGGRL